MNRALIVIDAQNDYDADGGAPIEFPPFADSTQNIGTAMDAAAEAGIPVVVVQHVSASGAPAFAPNTRGWQLHPIVAKRPRDLLLPKRFPGAFTGTALEGWLRERDITTVTLTGYMTQHCVSTTARQAYHAEFVAEVLSDATGTLSYDNAVAAVDAKTMHEVHLATLHAGFAAVATVEQWRDAVAAGGLLPMSNPIASRVA